MKRIAVLGSTGSIGRQTLDVAAHLSERIRVIALAARSNADLMEEQVRRFRPLIAVMVDKDACSDLKARLAGSGVEVLGGEENLVLAATHPEVNLVVSAVVGASGLLPTLAAVEAGKDIALANKETLVAAGELVTGRARERGVRILPVDSEHSAIFQSLASGSHSEIRRLLLTASGGPFRTTPKDELARVTKEEALAHPTWRMGGKITVDSATLMNKGLEVIEAHWLFDVPVESIEVVVHPESIVHSLVEFVDFSVIAQLGVADMRIPIQYALTYPERLPSPAQPLDLVKAGTLTFEAPDLDRFPCLGLAYTALRAGGTAPAALNAANETAVQLFLEGKIGFTGIPEVIDDVLAQLSPVSNPTLEAILECDRRARELARKAGVRRHNSR